MLGANIGIGDFQKVAKLNRLADLYGVDTISLGNVIGWAMEATEKKILKGDMAIEWGDFKKVVEVIEDITFKRTELGKLLAEGVRKASEEIGNNSQKFAMHVKGLEITAYDCHAAPGMALAYGTSPIGAHHKDAWIIAWEVRTDRLGYTREKVVKLIELQRIRGGMFETLVCCRLPWVEVGLELEWYFKLFKEVTGIDLTFDYIYEVADRIYTLIRSFWIREYKGWSREYDTPPLKWFEQPLTKGPFKGIKLDYDKYQQLLSIYYELRGWDSRGIPRKSTLIKLGLGYVIPELENIVKLEN